MSDSLTRYPIVIIEDDSVFRALTIDVLQDDGWSTFEAETVSEGKALIEVHYPCIVLCDYFLPDGSGAEILESADLQRCVFVVLTGQGEPEVAFQTLFQGADKYVSKPLKTPKELIEIVGEAREALRERLGERI